MADATFLNLGHKLNLSADNNGFTFQVIICLQCGKPKACAYSILNEELCSCPEIPQETGKVDGITFVNEGA